MHACMKTERDTFKEVFLNKSFLVINVTVSGNSAVVCVETEGTATDKSLGMP